MARCVFCGVYLRRGGKAVNLEPQKKQMVFVWNIEKSCYLLHPEGASVVIRPLELKGKQVRVLYSPAAVCLINEQA